MADEKESPFYPGKPIIYAEDVFRELRAHEHKHIPKLPDSLKSLPPIRIYNVSDIRHERGMGGLGAFTIQPCSPGMPCSVPLEIPFIFTEAIVVDKDHMEYRIHDGREIAEAIIGAARLSQPADRLWGTFIAHGQSPTLKELADATAALLQQYAALVSEMMAIYRDSPKERCNITALHLKALKTINENFQNRTA